MAGITKHIEPIGRHLVGLVLLGYLAWTLGQMALLLTPDYTRSLPTVAINNPTLSSRLPVPSGLLFGQIAAPAVVTNAPLTQTTLRLTLKGVFPSADPNRSMAIIAPVNGEDELYAIGAELSPGVTLVAVMADSVILKRGQQQELLYFEKPQENTLIAEDDRPVVAATANPPDAGSAVLPGSARDTYQQLSGTRQSRDTARSQSSHPLIQDINSLSVKQLIDHYDQTLRNDPQGLLASAGLKATGQSYQVLPTSPLTGLGLRAGDEIVSVNGQTLGNMNNDRELGLLIRSQGVARIEMRRGERRFFVNYPVR